jgi:cobalt-zinc-cadmium efflux system protein
MGLSLKMAGQAHRHDADDHAGHSHRHAAGHHHGHSRGHAHGAPASVSPATMAWAVGTTLAFVFIEAVAGWIGGSLALLSDAGHNLADAAALGLSWYALVVARKPSHHGMTYGYHRVAVIAAMINGLSLVAIALWIAWEAIGRLSNPEPPNSTLMIWVALVAVAVNVGITVRLHKGSKHDLNVRSAYMHMLGDAISTFAVVVAGVIIRLTGSAIVDPIMSLVIAAFIVQSSYGVLRESATVLLEGTPPGTDMPGVIAAIKAVSGVLDVHDLHVWMVGPGVIACSCHIVVREQSVREGQQVVREVVRDVEDRFHITHMTVQVEVEGCDPNDMHCVKERKV